MKSFLKKIVLFFLPLSILVILPITILFLGREYLPMREVVALQKDTDVLFGYGYNSISFIPYKEEMVKVYQPEIIALGTSRVMQLRSEFFSQSFVNAGGAVKTMGDIKDFIDGLEQGTSPKLLILSIDQDFLYKPTKSGQERGDQSIAKNIFLTLFDSSRRIYLDYLHHKFTFSQLYEGWVNHKAIGVAALITGDGFRRDGSYYYFTAAHSATHKNNLKSSIQQKVAEIRLASTAPPSKVNHFETNKEILSSILLSCKKKQIQVILFSPPFPNEVVQAMKASNTYQKNMVTEGISALREVAKNHRVTYFDFTDSSEQLGAELAFVDAIHGTDLLYAKMTLSMASSSPSFAKFVDVATLKKSVKESYNNFLR